VHVKEAIFIRPQVTIPVFSNLFAELRSNLQLKAPAAVNRGLIIAFIIAGYFVSAKHLGRYTPLYEALYATLATVVMQIQKKADAAFLHFARSILCDAIYKGLPVATIGLIYSLMNSLNYINTGIPTLDSLLQGFILSVMCMLAYSTTTIAVALMDYGVQKIYLKLTQGIRDAHPALKNLIRFLDSIFLDMAIIVDKHDERILTQNALPGFVVLNAVKNNANDVENQTQRYAPVAYSQAPLLSFR